MTDKMTRRDMIGLTGAGIGATLLGGAGTSAWAAEGSALPRPTPAQVRWQNCEIGAIFHYELPTAAGDHTENNATRKTFDPKLYNPGKLDTDQWVQAAKAGGAKYAVFTATHFNGFMQWQSDLYPYGVKQAAWRDGKGDVVADFVESCRKADILPGIYFSTHRNVYQTVWDHYVDWGRGRGTEAQAAYNRIAEKQCEELCSRYGDLLQIWFDAGVMTPEQGGPDVLPVFEKHQPDSVFYHSADRIDHRWIGNEQGNASYPCWATMPGKGNAISPAFYSSPESSRRELLGTGDPDGAVWSPGMATMCLRGARGAHDWLWYPNRRPEHLYSVDQLMGMYDRTVGRNSNIVIGLVVNPEGLVPEMDVRRMEEFGKALQTRFDNPLGSVSGQGREIALPLSQPGKPDLLVIQEDIAGGERVRKYLVEGRTPAGEWIELAQGQSIGHKRIQKLVPSADVDVLRLLVPESRARPLIKSFACYSEG